MASRDDEILDYIFNPQGVPNFLLNTPKPLTNVKTEATVMKEYSDEQRQKVRDMEIEAVKFAERNNLPKAIEILSEALQITPKNPSIYNNRAQAYRITKEYEKAMEDLNMAIQYCEGDDNVAKQAYTQRGLLFELKGDDASALQDFQKGAELGNAVAKQESVKLNPYAKLCNQMLAEAMKNCQYS